MKIEKNILKKRVLLFLKTSLQRWANSGYDFQHGGYIEALTFHGNPLYKRDKRFRIHGRNIFSHAAGTFWGYYDGLQTAEKTVPFLLNKCQKTHRGFVSTTTADGVHKDTHIRTYEHAFLMLGLGWLAYVSKKKKHLQLLQSVWNFVHQYLRHEDGGFITSLPSDGMPRQQNPHMHMFETFLNLYELFGEEKWLSEADNLYKLFATRFFKKEEAILREFFTDDWKPDNKRGNLINAGHHYEWTWLLYKYEKLSGNTVPQIPMLYTFATKYGTDAHGLGYDENYSDGRIYRDTHRLWVQTEALKAHLAMSAKTSDKQTKARYLMYADNVLHALFDYYFIEDIGVWYDQLNASGVNISKDAPASTLYHIVIALHEYLNFNKIK